MRYLSTRGGESVALEDAIMSGTAPDGGLYVPEQLPHFNPVELPVDAPLAEFAEIVLRPFFAGSSLEGELHDICAEAFNFPAPLRTINSKDNYIKFCHSDTRSPSGERSVAE